MSYEYDQYIKEHISNVKKGLEWLRDNLKLTGDAITEAIDNAEEHDRSKYSKEEYDAYDAYFYGGNRSYGVVKNFNLAWLHHQHENPHHWQYWVLVNDDPVEGSVALPMPDRYIYEMIADWWTFSWKNGDLTEIFDWYMTHRDYMLLHPRTRMFVEYVMENMAKRLVWDKIVNEETFDIQHDNMKEDKKYGLPELKKYPMPDADHVRSAIRFFNYVSPKDEEELAKNIIKCMKEYGMSFDDFNVGDENRFKKYIPEKEKDDA